MLSSNKRREILNLLLKKDTSVTELSNLLSIGIASTSKHLQILLSVGLISQRKSGKKNFYSLNTNELIPAIVWLESFGNLNVLDLDSLEQYFIDEAIL